MFKFLFPLALVSILVIDYWALPKSARRAWQVLAFTFGGAALLALYTEPLTIVSQWLGVGRPVDAVLYIAVAILVREFFLTRIRHRETQTQLTTLTRALAIQSAQRVSASPSETRPTPERSR